MKRYIKSLLVAVILIASLAPSLVGAAPVDVFKESCKDSSAKGQSQLCSEKQKKLFGPDSLWTNVVNTMIYIGGAASLLMIVIGGLRYTLSGGDTGDVTSAKNTVMYACIGLVIATMSYAIVNFVLSRI